MILTQSYRELGTNPKWVPVGIYTDEVELSDGQSRGRSFTEHVRELEKRAADLKILHARFKIYPGSAHPTYHRIRVVVTGDLYIRIPGEADVQDDSPAVSDTGSLTDGLPLKP